MSDKPADISQDVWDAAEAIMNSVGYYSPHDFSVMVATEIMAAERRSEEREREACAKMVDEGYVCRTCGHVGSVEHSGCEDWNIDQASSEQIAAAIRARKASQD